MQGLNQGDREGRTTKGYGESAQCTKRAREQVEEGPREEGIGLHVQLQSRGAKD